MLTERRRDGCQTVWSGLRARLTWTRSPTMSRVGSEQGYLAAAAQQVLCGVRPRDLGRLSGPGASRPGAPGPGRTQVFRRKPACRNGARRLSRRAGLSTGLSTERIHGGGGQVPSTTPANLARATRGQRPRRGLSSRSRPGDGRQLAGTGSDPSPSRERGRALAHVCAAAYSALLPANQTGSAACLLVLAGGPTVPADTGDWPGIKTLSAVTGAPQRGSQ